MLIVKCEDHLAAVKKFAMGTGQQTQLSSKLHFLSTYADENEEGKTQCVLRSDFAPQSFSFRMEKLDKFGEYKFWFNGGLIYHGNHDSGGNGGAPTYSVSLNSVQGWSVHT